MDWSAVRLFCLGIGGAVIMGSAIATAYYVGSAEPLVEDAPPGRATGATPPTAAAPPDAPASDPLPLVGDPSDLAPLPPPPPTSSTPPLKRTPTPTIPSGAGGAGGPGDEAPRGQQDETDEGDERDDANDGLLPPIDPVPGFEDVLLPPAPAAPSALPEVDAALGDLDAPLEGHSIGDAPVPPAAPADNEAPLEAVSEPIVVLAAEAPTRTLRSPITG